MNMKLKGNNENIENSYLTKMVNKLIAWEETNRIYEANKIFLNVD